MVEEIEEKLKEYYEFLTIEVEYAKIKTYKIFISITLTDYRNSDVIKGVEFYYNWEDHLTFTANIEQMRYNIEKAIIKFFRKEDKKMTKNEFLETVSKLVVEENNRRGNPLFSSVVIAQAICESLWGRSQKMMKANAIFGIKAFSDWKGKVYNSKTQECYDGSKYTDIQACFRAYNNLQESISDYFDLITKSERYRKACVANSPLECITAIKKGGYATSPTYINTIMSIINSNNLTKYDNVENSVDNSNKYIIGKNYTLQVDLNVRSGAGTNYAIKKYNELTVDGKRHAYKQEYAVLQKGTIVTCLDVIKNGNDIWLKIPSGYVAGYYEGKEYIK